MSDKKRSWDGPSESSVAKRLKSDETGTAPSNGTDIPADDLIAQKRAEIAAKVAAMRKAATSLVPPVHNLPPPEPPEDLARRVAEARRIVADAQRKLAVKENPYMSMPQGKKSRPVESAQQGAGLKMAAHPLLLDTTPTAPQSKKDRYKPMQPKFASIKANTRNAPTPPPPPPPPPAVDANPYAAAAQGSGLESAPKERTGRQFRFNPKGKYVQIANQLRQDSQLEALKQRIAESARKAGLDSEFETLEKNIRRTPPPEAEWWDVAFLPNKMYSDVDNLGLERLYISNPDSPITIYIQHPIPIPAPGDKNKAGLKPLMLTKKEQKKMRKQRRQAELQDKRDRIRMGLIPPDAPKVRLANLMKVLTSDAVQDPTRVEARVRREVAMRKHGHEKMNAERKLTDDQRREKVESKKADEEKKGIFGAVFKVKVFSDPAHRFKVRKNAEQMSLTGVCIFNPAFSVVYVEGAAKFIRSFKRLMLHRMAWTEAARSRGAEEVDLASNASDGESKDNGKGKGRAQEDGVELGVASLEGNACHLVWEGQIRDRAFAGFKPRSCPTDGSAKEVLGPKLSGYWDMAKNMRPEEEEEF